MKPHVLGFALLSAIAIIANTPAQAQNGSLTRSFVSSSGVDTNACTIAAPCATFAVAYTKIGANGIVAALDPGKYGPLTITGPVTINGNGWAAITAPAQGNGITVNAGAGNVILTGLEIDGAGAAYNGIVFNSGTSLAVTNCVMQNFVQDSGHDQNTGNGIVIAPATEPAYTASVEFTITGTTASNNAWAGIGYFPPQSSTASAIGQIDHVIATNNLIGIAVGWIYGDGPVAVSISNSVASNNLTQGITVLNGTVMVDSDQINNNGNGLTVEPGNNETAVGYLSRSTFTNNYGYAVYSGVNSISSFGNNQIIGNGNNDAIVGVTTVSTK